MKSFNQSILFLLINTFISLFAFGQNNIDNSNSNKDLSDLSYGQKVIRSILGDDLGQMNFYSKDAIKFRKYLEYSVLSDMSNTYSDRSFSNSSTKIHFCPDGNFLQSISSHINISGDYIDVTNAGDMHIPGYWDIATLPNNTFIILFYSTHSFILEDFPNGFIPFPVAQYNEDYVAMPTGDGYYRTANQNCN